MTPYNNIPDSVSDPVIKGLWGFDWRVGRSWGVAHPKDNCYAGGNQVFVNRDDLHKKHGIPPLLLGIGENLRTFDIEGEKKLYKYEVGYISSINTIKYGILRCEFVLPLGNGLWPAIWLTDGKTWPPEVDIMEAWSGKHNYCLNIFANDIFPSMHLGNNTGNHHCHSFRTFRGSLRQYLNPYRKNTCELIWTPNVMVIKYNDHVVGYEDRPEVLRWFNESDGMEIHLNNYIDDKVFTGSMSDMFDYLRIYNLQYTPLAPGWEPKISKFKKFIYKLLWYKK